MSILTFNLFINNQQPKSFIIRNETYDRKLTTKKKLEELANKYFILITNQEIFDTKELINNELPFTITTFIPELNGNTILITEQVIYESSKTYNPNKLEELAKSCYEEVVKQLSDLNDRTEFLKNTKSELLDMFPSIITDAVCYTFEMYINDATINKIWTNSRKEMLDFIYVCNDEFDPIPFKPNEDKKYEYTLMLCYLSAQLQPCLIRNGLITEEYKYPRFIEVLQYTAKNSEKYENEFLKPLKQLTKKQ